MDKNKSFWIGGYHSVVAAINNPKRVVEKVVTSNEKIYEKIKKYIQNRKNFNLVEKNFIDNLFKNYDLSHQGVAAKLQKIDNLDIKNHYNTDRNYVILDGISDPRNIGSIIRSCAVFGVDGVILKKNSFDVCSPFFYKTASGGVEFIKIFYVSNLNSITQLLKKKDFWVYGFSEKSEKLINNEKFSKKNIFIFGSEEKGISRLLIQNCDNLLKFKTNKNFNTLNVSNAVTAALSIYQVNSF